MSLQLSSFAPAARALKIPNVRHTLRTVVSISVAAMMFASSLVLTVSARSQSVAKSAVEDVDSFIIETGPDGRSICRLAKPWEIQSTRPRPDDVPIPVKQLLKDSPNQLRSDGGNNAATGLTINLNALSQLQADPNKAKVIAAFERAAAVWTSRIKSPVTIDINIDYGVNLPGGGAFGPNTLGSTSSRRTLIDYPGARTNLLAGAKDNAERAIYNRLPATFVPTDVGNGGVIGVSRSVAFALGIPVSSPADPLVATIAFNKNFPFDFNPDDGIHPALTDFDAVAVHEIGHALGFTSGAGDGDTGIVSLWDLYRFRPGTTTGSFPTAQRVMSIGGEQVYFTGETFTVSGTPTTELRLSTGGPDPDDGDGDENQSSHWKDDSLNNGQFIGIMDPAIGPGRREEANSNDFAALEVIGWNFVNSVAPPPPPPPPPAPSNDNFANAQTLSGCSGSVIGTNIGATRESSEPNHSPDGHGGSRSVWYRWQAPSSGSVTISTTGSRFDTVLSVYTGSAVNSLALIGNDDDDNDGADKTSTVTFTAAAGTTYRIAVDGYDNNSGGDFGPIVVNWSASTCNVAVPLLIMLDQSGPAADQAIAVDSILMVRDPFRVINPANLISPASDRNTRVVIYVDDLQLQSGAPASALTINLIDGSNQTFNVAAQDYHQNTDNPLTQITFRLPSNLAAGTCKVKVVTQNQVSNTATFRITQ